MVPLAAVVVVFTISNRGVVSIDLWPAPYSLDVPVFAAVLAAALVGFLCGGIISFISAGRRRARNRELMRMLENSRREEAMLREQIRKLEAANKEKSATPLPASAPPPMLSKVDAA
jgi:uncharacterized integral membrane protein